MLANSVPADAYFGLVLMAVVLIGGIVMTALVILRNRKASDQERDEDPSA